MHDDEDKPAGMSIQARRCHGFCGGWRDPQTIGSSGGFHFNVFTLDALDDQRIRVRGYWCAGGFEPLEERVRRALRVRADSIDIEPLSDVECLDAPTLTDVGHDHGSRRTRWIGATGAGLAVAASVVLALTLSGERRRPTAVIATTPSTAAATTTPPVPVTTAVSTTIPVAGHRAEAGFAMAQLVGNDLVWSDSDGSEIARHHLGDAGGFGRSVIATPQRVIVQTGGRVQVFDPNAPSNQPGSFEFLNAPVLTTPDGFWAADQQLSSAAPAIWHKYEWTEHGASRISEPEITIGRPDSQAAWEFPRAAIAGGLVTESMTTGRIAFHDADHTVDLGPGQVIGVDQTSVIVFDNATLTRVDPLTGASQIITDGLDGVLAQSIGAATVTPSGEYAVMLLKPGENQPADLFVVDLHATSARRTMALGDTDYVSVAVLGPDTVGVGGAGAATAIDVTTMATLDTAHAADPSPVSVTVSPAGVVGPRWLLMSPEAAGVTPWFQLFADGTMTASDGCSKLAGDNGSWSLDGDTLTAAPTTLTEPNCAPDHARVDVFGGEPVAIDLHDTSNITLTTGDNTVFAGFALSQSRRATPEALIGSWSDRTGNTFQFHDDGTLTFTRDTTCTDGHYEWLDARLSVDFGSCGDSAIRLASPIFRNTTVYNTPLPDVLLLDGDAGPYTLTRET